MTEGAAGGLLAAIDHLEGRFREIEPAVLAFVPEAGRFERLRHEVGELLERYPDPGERPALFGCLAGVKDIFHVAGLPTGAGSRLPVEDLTGGAAAREEAVSVARLRAAGALIVGKTVTTEFAYYAPGPTRNPLDPRRTPGGSSSGSAAGVAAGLCDLALGTQTIGSITRPAAFCGVAGYKPSYDLVPRDGVIPLAPSLDHIGCFARDLALLRQAAAVLRNDPPPAPEVAVEDRTRTEPLVLGVPRGPYLERASEAALEHFGEACGQLAGPGIQVRTLPAMPDFGEIEAGLHLLVAAEAADVHRDWFARHADLYHPKTAELIRRGQTAAPQAVAAARAGRDRLRRELTELMDESGIDAWISPAAPDVAPQGLDSTGDPVLNLPWSYSGLPTVGIPSGRNTQGLPYGLQLAGRWREDDTLLRRTERIERRLT